jgi:hypothetical protein
MDTKLALEVVAIHQPECELKLTCVLYNSYCYIGRMKNTIYNMNNTIYNSHFSSIEWFKNINSWLVPEVRGKSFKVLLLNHSTHELLITTPPDIPLCILNLSQPEVNETIARFSLEDSYEIRPIQQGIKIEERDYAAINGTLKPFCI